ncbi:MAG: HNH endonuclease signature motif containing protein [Cyanobacteria bacterium J06649_4]
MPPDAKRVSIRLREEVSERANQLCEYCKCPDAFSPDSFTVDHIHPRQAGGSTVSENLAWACFGCNGRKHKRTTAIDTQTGTKTMLFNPRQQSWKEHFAWNRDTTQMIGKTPCGRATIEALALNRFGVANLRRLLTSAGLHPPT